MDVNEEGSEQDVFESNYKFVNNEVYSICIRIDNECFINASTLVYAE